MLRAMALELTSDHICVNEQEDEKLRISRAPFLRRRRHSIFGRVSGAWLLTTDRLLQYHHLPWTIMDRQELVRNAVAFLADPAVSRNYKNCYGLLSIWNRPKRHL